MGDAAEGRRDPRLGGPVGSHSSRRHERAQSPADGRTGVVVRPRLRDEPRVPDGRRPRRFEPFPRWGYVLLALTAVVTPVALYLALHDRAATEGTSCGSALFGNGTEGQGVDAVCSNLMADAQPVVVAVGAVAVLLVITSITTLTVRAWVPREASTPD